MHHTILELCVCKIYHGNLKKKSHNIPLPKVNDKIVTVCMRDSEVKQSLQECVAGLTCDSMILVPTWW